MQWQRETYVVDSVPIEISVDFSIEYVCEIEQVEANMRLLHLRPEMTESSGTELKTDSSQASRRPTTSVEQTGYLKTA